MNKFIKFAYVAVFYLMIQTVISYAFFTYMGNPPLDNTLGLNLNFVASVVTMAPLLWAIRYCMKRAIYNP
jgi:hypothetical protein